MTKITILLLSILIVLLMAKQTVGQTGELRVGGAEGDGEDGASSRDPRCNGLVWASMCVRDQAVITNCERAPEGTKRGDKCRYAAKLCTLRPGAKKSSFAASVKKTCFD
ncbi:hypothetical protein K7432_012405 [Basidiobolus ranarum]|uniref:Uncharacterized protein n=1 Tax=Basidiobolus ranarum TaxID=34480 RepID=A0ABR2WKT1_9FUNG